MVPALWVRTAGDQCSVRSGQPGEFKVTSAAAASQELEGLSQHHHNNTIALPLEQPLEKAQWLFPFFAVLFPFLPLTDYLPQHCIKYSVLLNIFQLKWSKLPDFTGSGIKEFYDFFAKWMNCKYELPLLTRHSQGVALDFRTLVRKRFWWKQLQWSFPIFEFKFYPCMVLAGIEFIHFTVASLRFQCCFSVVVSVSPKQSWF